MEKYKKTHLWRNLSSALSWLITLRGTPKAISLGVAIGIFIAFTPTIGLQIFIAAFFSIIFNANRAAAVAFVWITNPLTMPFIYGFTYRIGNFFWGGPPLVKVKQLLLKADYTLDKQGIWGVYDKLKILLSLGKDIFIPLSIGGTIIGIFAGSLSYVVVLKTIKYYRNRVRATAHRKKLTLFPKRSGENP
ncbi:MAG: DUF2062 domain-containing protein [Candidatus Scalindua sp. AMX11]|nr:MAG: DUF2062 domain-containing protein [Candidatus Scalindua sp.]NOG84726.1 DUF2062 domain-containing protein [Planctomycetota bacterium]RZV98332.1 MAG: DUF2062 domain-containing protein [Candidatus Scalindua sp. SCAELEC01]TDE66575.1 MAG: DUF2062 domain-containing protein [Candidatus Scalindua sp. AMX11]GJQ58944.1 MAG: hypothetical protein SCALA701_17450 [Candidatus Scalindua sp.]